MTGQDVGEAGNAGAHAINALQSSHSGSGLRTGATPPPGEPLPPEMPPDGPPPLGEVLLRVLRSPRTASVSIAVGLHIVLLTVLGLITLTTPSGDGEGAGGPVEMAVMTEAELDDLSAGALGFTGPAVPDAEAASAEQSVALPGVPMGDEPGGPAVELTGVGDLGGGGDVAGAGGLGLGGSGGGGGTSFFGVEARGERIAFIVDISGSMMGTRLDRAKRELVQALNGLPSNAYFSVMLFSDSARPLLDRVGWADATDRGKRTAARRVGEVQAENGTFPLEAFVATLRLRPRPDAIFFLCDGEFDEGVVTEVALMNAELRVPIHCIALGNEGGLENMRRLAADSNGSFTFIQEGGGR